MTLTLSLLRHAKSAWGDIGAEDVDRGLAERGIEAAPRMGRAMRKLGLKPDLILCSAAIRTRATLTLVLPELRLEDPEIRYEDALYLASPVTLHDTLKSLPDRAGHVLVIGHNPGLHALALALAGSGDKGALADLSAKFPTAALAVLTFETDSWRKIRTGQGRLRHFVTPRSLKD
jgi:phosphohistidine phosphatase